MQTMWDQRKDGDQTVAVMSRPTVITKRATIQLRARSFGRSVEKSKNQWQHQNENENCKRLGDMNIFTDHVTHQYRPVNIWVDKTAEIISITDNVVSWNENV